MTLKTICLLPIAAFAFAFFSWKITSTSAYETAKYTVLESDKNFEIREYPELTTVVTKMKVDTKRNDGSFMRLFRYISGDNDNKQKVAMTTPVFVETSQGIEEGKMQFVLPEKVAEGRVPEPTNEQVEIKKRPGGKFAVIRFKGRLNAQAVSKSAKSLREWMKTKGIEGEEGIESAGYDPPWTPGPMRRNEVLIRLKTAEEKTAQQEQAPAGQ